MCSLYFAGAAGLLVSQPFDTVKVRKILNIVNASNYNNINNENYDDS